MEIKSSEIPAIYEENSISNSFCKLTKLAVQATEKISPSRQLNTVEDFAINPDKYDIETNRFGFIAKDKNKNTFVIVKGYVSNITISGGEKHKRNTYQYSVVEKGESTTVFNLAKNPDGSAEISTPNSFNRIKLGDNFNDRKIIRDGFKYGEHQKNSTISRH